MCQCRFGNNDVSACIHIFDRCGCLIQTSSVFLKILHPHFNSMRPVNSSACLHFAQRRQLHNLHIRLMRQEIIGIDFRVLCHGLSLIAILINTRLCAALSGGFFVPVAVLRPAGSGPPPRVPDSPPLFQSTLPMWGATAPDNQTFQLFRISIHAPRVGSDSKIAQFFACNFAQK